MKADEVCLSQLQLRHPLQVEGGSARDGPVRSTKLASTTLIVETAQPAPSFTRQRRLGVTLAKYTQQHLQGRSAPSS